MKLYLTIIASTWLVIGISARNGTECWHFEGKENEAYKQKVAAFDKQMVLFAPSMVNLIKISSESGYTPEEIISIPDTNDSCDMDKNELFALLDRWAQLRKTTLSKSTRNFAAKAYDYMDDNSDGFVDPSEINAAIQTSMRHKNLGAVAETLFGFF